ncbi:Agenet domain-containing protein [Prunus dulcis]|uniref:Agenet domain-containing protein n=1 Tax=Prunus dulcis TaxID=3755 RepID=A0A4Y1R5L7_PRUDU|nr:Agenet domain-containing protein [Prunus dulcis]
MNTKTSKKVMVKRRRRSEAHLSKDSKVEVRSNEEVTERLWPRTMTQTSHILSSFTRAPSAQCLLLLTILTSPLSLPTCEDDKSDLLELKRSELRPHWDFLNGKWVRPRKKRMVGSVFSPGTAVEVNLSKEHIFGAWLPAIYLGELGDNSTMVISNKG